MTLVSRFLCFFFECQSLVFDSFRRVCGAGVRNGGRFGNESMRLSLVECEMNNVVKSKKRAQEVGWGGVGWGSVRCKPNHFPFALPHDGIILPVVTQGDFVYSQ